jgi:hypothetical protein
LCACARVGEGKEDSPCRYDERVRVILFAVFVMSFTLLFFLLSSLVDLTSGNALYFFYFPTSITPPRTLQKAKALVFTHKAPYHPPFFPHLLFFLFALLYKHHCFKRNSNKKKEHTQKKEKRNAFLPLLFLFVLG